MGGASCDVYSKAGGLKRIPRFCGGVTLINSKLFCGEKFKSSAFWASQDRWFFDGGVFFFDIVNMNEKVVELCLKLCVEKCV